MTEATLPPLDDHGPTQAWGDRQRGMTSRASAPAATVTREAQREQVQRVQATPARPSSWGDKPQGESAPGSVGLITPPFSTPILPPVLEICIMNLVH